MARNGENTKPLRYEKETRGVRMEKEIRNKLIDTAIAQLQYSYTPYSNFKVGAALLAKMVRPTLAATLKTQATPPPTARSEPPFSRL